MKILVRKSLSAVGLLSAVTACRLFILHVRSRPKWSELLFRETIFLELGSGAKKGSNGWTTVDISGADIAHDLRRGISLPANSVDKIYTSHLLEHLEYKSLIEFINERYRVLKLGGELSVCVPDASLYIRAYLAGEVFMPSADRYEPALVTTGSLMDQVNYVSYCGGHHKYMFDSENLVNTLGMAPFSKIQLREFDPDLDLESRDFESIYASARK